MGKECHYLSPPDLVRRKRMNKKAFSSGVTWFFAIVATFVLLILFYASAKFFFLASTSPSASPEFSGIRDINNLRQLSFFEKYSQGAVYNQFAYSVYESSFYEPPSSITSDKERLLRNDFLKYLQEIFLINSETYNSSPFCYGLTINDYFLGSSSSFFYEDFSSLLQSSHPLLSKEVLLKSSYKLNTGDFSLELKNNKEGIIKVGVKVGGCNE